LGHAFTELNVKLVVDALTQFNGNCFLCHGYIPAKLLKNAFECKSLRHPSDYSFGSLNLNQFNIDELGKDGLE
jgi:hypothetical protein